MSNPSDVSGSFGQTYGGQIGLPGVTSTGSTTSSTGAKKTGYSSNDSLAAAQMAALAMSWSMNVPILPSPENASKIFDLGIAKIASDVLDAWAASIQKQADERRAEENSPAYQAEQEEKHSRDTGIITTVSDYMDELKASGDTPMLSNLTNAIVISALFTGVLGQGVVDVASTTLSAVTPQVSFAAQFGAQGLAPLSDDFRGQLGLIGAWAMGTLLTRSTFEAVGQKEKGKPVNDRVLADKYAGKILSLVKSDQLNNFIAAMLVTKSEKGQPLNNQRKQELASGLKLVVLSSALAAVYKSKTGKITGQEFLDLANGTLKAEKGVEAQLVTAIRAELKMMNPTDKFHMLNALAAYMDKDPKLSSFFDIGETFDKINEELILPPDAVKT